MRLTLGQAAEVRLGRQRAPQHESGEHVIPYLRSANVIDGRLDLTDVKEMNFSPEEQHVFDLRRGDVLLTEGSGSRDTVGTSAVWQDDLKGRVCFQNTLLRLRPRPGVTHGRYLSWWARHARHSGQIAAVSTGANILHIGSDGLKRLRLMVPPITEQQRVADFLDDRVARIDRIIAARREQQELFDHQLTSLVRAGVAGAISGVVETSMTQVPWVPAASADAVPLTLARVLVLQRGVDLTADERVAGSAAVVTTAGVVGTHDRAIQDGPGVVIGRYGSVGNVHWVDGPYWPHNTTLYVKDTLGNDMRWVYYLLRSFPYGAMQARAAIPGINRNDLATETVPWIPLEQQRRCAGWLDEAVAEHETRQSSLSRSIDLLTEYKISLITAAVTGELDVTTAGSGLPDAH